MTRADLKHCGKIPDAREELNRSVREGRIESRHSIKSLEGMGSSSHDLGAELRMHSFTVNCDTFSNEEKVAAVVPVTSVEVTCSEAMLALSFSTLLVKCLMKILGRSALGQMVGNILGGCLFECINYLVQFFTGRCQGYSFSVKFTLGCVHKFLLMTWTSL